MNELTLEGVGWAWTATRSLIWDADACSLTMVVENAQVPAGQDELRRDLDITFTNVAYFKVNREPGWLLDQMEVESIEEVDSLPSLGALDTVQFDGVRTPDVLFGTEPAYRSLGKPGEVRMFVLTAGELMAEFTAHDYTIRLGFPEAPARPGPQA